ncbi:MAG: DUF3999 family protein [Planctomycetes bacterium]|nr:DUF3999 family protein [Planctomycetota bacterium]
MQRRPCGTVACGLMTLALACFVPLAARADAPQPELWRWQYWQEIKLPEDAEGKYRDVLLPVDVFGKARIDLGDLRLYDAAGVEVPYALRVLAQVDRDDKITPRQFNQVAGPDNSREISLDLEGDTERHNQVQIETVGAEFRRRVELEGSDDGTQWRKLGAGYLVRFTRDNDKLNGDRITYPPSRFRYIRLRVFRDPETDKNKDITITTVSVHRKVAVPGELVTWEAKLGPRMPVNSNGTPASAWDITLGGDLVPCEKILVDVAEEAFVRDYTLQAKGRPDAVRPSGGSPEWEESYSPPRNARLGATYQTEAASYFRYPVSGKWQRRPGNERKAMEAKFGEEVRASQVRITVVDNANAPLTLSNVRVQAPARELVFAHTEGLKLPLRLYYGNPLANSPEYDFGRNLPEVLSPTPKRLELGAPTPNAEFRGSKPLTERWPWLVYSVLGAACGALGLVLLNLSRATIAAHDRNEPSAPAA